MELGLLEAFAEELGGKEEGTYELFACRDLYKRLYYLFDRLRGPERKPYLLGHGFAGCAPYRSFWDATVNGEEIKPKKRFGLTKLLLQKRLNGRPVAVPMADPADLSYDAFSYRCSRGAQFGIPNIYLPQYGYIPELKLNEHSREVLSVTFLHNTTLWAAYIPTEPIYEFWRKVEVPFGMGDATFCPYWSNGIVATPDCVRVSYWKKLKKDDYLVAVANWGDDEVNARIEMPGELAGLKRCVDIEQGERTPLTAAVSRDDGQTWQNTKTLYDDPKGWYCYTALEFVDGHVVLAHCAGHRHLAQTNVTRFPVKWLYGEGAGARR